MYGLSFPFLNLFLSLFYLFKFLFCHLMLGSTYAFFKLHFFFSFPAFRWIENGFFLPFSHFVALEVICSVTIEGVSARILTKSYLYFSSDVQNYSLPLPASQTLSFSVFPCAHKYPCPLTFHMFRSMF